MTAEAPPVEIADGPLEHLADPSLEHLLARLSVLDARVRAAVEQRRAIDPEPGDQFRGLYLSEPAVDRLLEARPGATWAAYSPAVIEAIEARADAEEAGGARLRLRTVARSFDLDLVDTELLLAALMPDIDPRFEGLYGYLQDDVTRRRAGIGLALELCGLETTDSGARGRLSDRGSLVRHGLLLIEDSQRPALSRSLRVPDRVTSFLLGSDAPEADLALAIADSPRAEAYPPLVLAMTEGLPVVYLRETGMASGIATAVGSVAGSGRRWLGVDLGRLAAAARPTELAAGALREARLSRSVLVAGPVDALAASLADVIHLFASDEWPTILVGQRPWDPAWSHEVPLVLEAPQPTSDERASFWHWALRPLVADGSEGEGAARVAELVDATRAFHLSLPQIARASEAGRLRALADDRPLDSSDVRSGARAQNAAGLERLAHRIEPSADWADLIVPLDVAAQLGELGARAKHRERVIDEWQVGGRSNRGHGITALFGGESGTGKTLAAEVIAATLGLDLYVIDLSTVVDKYIGETEKNLDRIFSEAARVNGVLLFDEADAIFGKRSEVRDSRDRYANLEVAYLLQRMERFEGLAILTTNLRANVDEAFTRRLDVIVDFPMPDEDARLALWRMHLPPGLPQGPDLDLDFMARRFRVSGGHIRNICLTAAYLAADSGVAVTMAHLIRSTEREYRKLGRLTLEDEFGPYHSLVTSARTNGSGRRGAHPGGRHDP